MQPCRDTASTGYALVDPGSEYLVLEPHGDGRPFTVQVRAGSYRVEWFGVATRETSSGGTRTVERDAPVELTAPFASGPAVLYLQRTLEDRT
jgi:hypothetical protein